MEKFLRKLIYKIIDGFAVEDLERLEMKIRQLLLRKKAADHHFASFSNWQILHRRWNDYLSPWRPSRGDLKIYEDAISTFPSNSRILILGATPELRDLVASFSFKPVIADFSLPMIIEMLRYAEKVNIDDEIWLKSDWLEAPLDGNFDVVLGDMVLRLIEAEQGEKFLNKIKNILSPKGIFITRMHFIDESLSELTGEEILNKSISISDEKLAVNVISGRIFDKFSDLTNNIIYQKKAIEFMREAAKTAKNFREKVIFSKALKFIRGGMGWPIMRGENRWLINSKTQLENLLDKFFDIVDVKIAGDYPDSKFYPIYFLKPNKNNL